MMLSRETCLHIYTPGVEIYQASLFLLSELPLNLGGATFLCAPLKLFIVNILKGEYLMQTTKHTGYTTRLRYTAILLILLFVTVLAGGCAQSADKAGQEQTTELFNEASAENVADSTQEPASTAITVTDMTGRQVTLDKPAEKIVALAASDCEILYAIGAGDTLVGRGEYCDYPAEVVNVPAVQSGSETNIEQIIALSPQVVIMSIMSQTKEQVAALEDAGIEVIAVNAQDIEGVYTAIGLIGTITGRDSEAAAVIDDMKAAFVELSGNASGDGTQTVYFEVSPLEYGLWTAGNGTFMNELSAMLGVKNAFEDVQGWGEISQEQVIERNPDYIVTIAMYFGEGLPPVDEIMGREGWQEIKAIKNKKVLNLNSDEISRPGPRLADALADMHSFIFGNKPAEPAS